MKTDVLEFQNMMNDFVFVSTIQTCLTFKEIKLFLIFNPLYSRAPGLATNAGAKNIVMFLRG